MRKVQDNKILIIDIEATGFLRSGGKIVGVGIVELSLDTGETTIIFDEVTHERPITRVEEAWNYLFPEIPYTEKHQGADDALHEAKIVYELYIKGKFKMITKQNQ